MNSQWNPFSYPPRAVLKSVWGFVLPILAIILNELQAGRDVTWRTLGVAVLSGVVTGYGTFAVKNTPPGDVTPMEAGALNLWAAIGFALVVIGILGLLGVLSLSLVVSIVLCVVGIVLLVVPFRRI